MIIDKSRELNISESSPTSNLSDRNNSACQRNKMGHFTVTFNYDSDHK